MEKAHATSPTGPEHPARCDVPGDVPRFRGVTHGGTSGCSRSTGSGSPASKGARTCVQGNSRATLIARRELLLDTLASKVRLLTLEQVATLWSLGRVDKRVGVRAALQRLAQRGLVTLSAVAIQEPVAPVQPTFRWEPGLPGPSPTELAALLRRRWSLPSRRATVVEITPPAAEARGCRPPHPARPSEVSHDVRLAEVYLLFRRTRPDEARHWLAEAELLARGFGDNAPLPDAMVASRGRRLVIEVLGQYPATKLAEFHEFCEGKELPYEFW